MRQAARHIPFHTVLGEAEPNHRLCQEEMGVARTLIRLNRRKTERRWLKTRHRRAMRHRLLKPLYHPRWRIESGFSQHIHRLGSALTARKLEGQNREIILRVCTHNIMILADENPSAFQQSKAWLNT